MAVNKKKRKPVGRQTGPKDGTGPSGTGKKDQNKFSVMSLAEKIKERQRMNKKMAESI